MKKGSMVKSNVRRAGIMLVAFAMLWGLWGGSAKAVGVHVDERYAGSHGDETDAGGHGGGTNSGVHGDETDAQGSGEAHPARASDGAGIIRGVDGLNMLSVNPSEAAAPGAPMEVPTPLGEQFHAMAEGKADAKAVLLDRTLELLRAGTLKNTALDIGAGDIVIKAGGEYTQSVDGRLQTSGTAADNRFTISGTTDKYNITVEEGALPVITLQHITCNLTAADKKSSIDIKSGAKVTLLLENGTSGPADITSLTGSVSMPAITLEDGASLRLEGSGSLSVYGGGGAFAMGGADTALPGGALWTGGSADLKAYSNMAGGALNVKLSTAADTKRILQGSLDTAVTADTIVKAENRDKRTEQYVMKLKAGALSFATSTTVAGGNYVSYFAAAENAPVAGGELLADKTNQSFHSYNLTGAGNTMAVLRNLTPRRIEYRVTLDADGGRFSDNQPKHILEHIGYGETITKPGEDPSRDNHKFAGWHKTKDSFEDTDKWIFSPDTKADSVVRDGVILYAAWEPINCTVVFRDGQQTAKTLTGKHFKDTIAAVEAPALTITGSTLDGWLREDGSKWEFGDSGNKIMKETTVLKANWLRDCKVTFDANAKGSVVSNMPSPNPITVSATMSVPPVNTPVRVGYQFRAWYTDPACTKKWDMDADKVIRDITLYAGWGADETKVSFHVDAEKGETVNPPQVSVSFGNQIPKPAATKPGRSDLPTEYAVQGWYTDLGLKDEWDFSQGLEDSDGLFDLYVKWHQKTCWASFQPNSTDAHVNEGADTTLSVNYNNSLKTHVDLDDKLNKMFARTGYEVKNWLGADGRVWDMDTPLTEDIILKAQWTPKIFTVRFETPSGAPALPTNQQSREAAYGTTLQKPDYPGTGSPWPGHTFQGWYTRDGGAGDKWNFSGEPGADTVADDTTLHAHWTEDEYTVRFQTYDGDEHPIPSLTGVKYGQTVTEPTAPVRDHYRLTGWVTEDGKAWDFHDSTVTGDMTLYAKWEGEPVKVTLNVKFEPENADPGKTLQVNLPGIRYGDYLTQEQVEDQSVTATKKRPGYTLNGWFTGPDYQPEQKWDFAAAKVEPEGSELSLYAYWTWDEYTVRFVTFQGDESVPPQTGLRYGDKAARPAPDPARPHYTFEAWHKEADAGDENIWNFATETVTKDTTLYASWIPDIYTLSFETNGGTALPPVSVAYGTYVPAESLKTTKEGYVFAGWYTDPGLTQAFNPAAQYVDRNMTLYAKWGLRTYTVKFHFRDSKEGKGETVDTYANVYHVGDYLTKPNKTEPHKTLSNWYKDEGYKDKWLFGRDKLEGDTDLYAYWSDTEYNVHFETDGGTKIEDTTMTWGTQPKKPADPEKKGYTFTGWFKDDKLSVPWDFEEDFVDGDTNIYAGWSVNMYTVTFDGDEGGPVPDPQSLPYGASITEPEAPARDGFEFTGWQAEGKDVPWDFAKDVVEGDITLKAQWKDPNAPDPNAQSPGGQAPNNQNPDNSQGGNAVAAADPKAGAGGANGPGPGTSAAKGTQGAQSNTGTGNGNQSLTKTADAIKKILTGDDAPLTYAIAGIILAAAVIIWVLYKKFKK